jgi:hypothetical protein
MNQEGEFIFRQPDPFKVAQPHGASSEASLPPNFMAEPAQGRSASSAVAHRKPQRSRFLQPTLVLSDFEFNAADLRSTHLPLIEHVARYAISCAGNRRVVGVIRLLGYADVSESNSDGIELGQQRAVAVEQKLRNAIDQLWPGLNDRVQYITQSRRAYGLGDASRPSAGNPVNRRVEIFVYLYPARVPVRYPVIRRNATSGYQWAEGISTRQTERHQPERKIPDQNELRATPPPGLVPVCSYTDPPNGWICSLHLDFGKDTRSLSSASQPITVGATGLLISSRHILTAGQCLYSRSRMHPISRMTLHGAVTEFLPINPHSVLVIPPRLESDGNGVMANVFVKDAKFLRISDRWGASRATNASFNFGLITLERPLTPNRGFWGTGKNRIAPLIDAELQDAVVHTIRYADRGDFQPSVETRHFQENKNKTQWSAIGHISCVEKYTLSHDMPAFSGQAGAPIWIEQGEDRMLVGIATVGHQAVRITFDLLLQLREWMGRDGV